MTPAEVTALEAALKLARRSKAPFTFWYCAKGDDDEPMLYVGKRGADVKSLVSTAKKANRIQSTVRITGTVGPGDAGLKFEVGDEADAGVFNRALTQTLGAASSLKAKVKPLLSGATVEQVALVVDNVVAVKLGDRLEYAKWIEASGVKTKPRSALLKVVDTRIQAWCDTPPPTPAEQRDAMEDIKKAASTWLADKAGEGMRGEAGKALIALSTKLHKKLEVVAKAMADAEALFDTELLDTALEERQRYARVMEPVDSYKNTKVPECVAIQPRVRELGLRLDERVQPLLEKEAAAKDDADLLKLKGMIKASTWAMVEARKNKEVFDEAGLYAALFDDLFAYGRSNWTYKTSAPQGADLLSGTKVGACGTFARAFMRACSIAMGKKVGDVKEIGAKNFYTIPIARLGFVDAGHAGNLAVGEEAPSRFFFSSHWITEVGGKRWDLTTGRRDAAIDQAVEESGFSETTPKVYTKGRDTIRVQAGDGGGVYVLTKGV